MPKSHTPGAGKPETKSERVPRPLAPFDERLRYDVVEAAGYLRLSVSKVYKDIRAGRLRAIEDGGRRYIPGSEILRRSQLPHQEAQ